MAGTDEKWAEITQSASAALSRTPPPVSAPLVAPEEEPEEPVLTDEQRQEVRDRIAASKEVRGIILEIATRVPGGHAPLILRHEIADALWAAGYRKVVD